MKKHYYLFLDESKPNGSNINYLCLGGVITEKTEYEKQIIKKVNDIKKSVFGNTEIVLHESQIRDARNEFSEMRKIEKRNLFWSELKKLFIDYNIVTIGAAINEDEYKSLYGKSYKNDEYFIVLQIVLENFLHFLQNNDGVGSVYIESRNPKEDMCVKNIYHKIIANGTLYLNENAFQDKLLNLNFIIKADNHIGVQLADFIPGTLNRECNGLRPKTPSLLNEIKSNLYDGNCKLKDRFGLKKLL